MSKPKSFDSWTLEKQKEWKEKKAEQHRKWYEENREKKAEKDRKWHEANREKRAEQHRKWYEEKKHQSAADQFFIMAGAAEQISQTIKNKTK